MNEAPFQSALRTAEQTGDWSDVISLYIAAAKGPGEAFNLTHAYIHALEAGDIRAQALKQRLIALGAEVDDTPAP